MKSQKRISNKLLNFIVSWHPLDLVSSVLILFIALIFHNNIRIKTDAPLSAISTVSSLLMTVTTFGYTLLYQSDTKRLKIARLRYINTITSAWLDILFWSSVTTVLSIIGLAFEDKSTIPCLILIFCFFIIVAKLARTVWWVYYILVLVEYDQIDNQPQKNEFNHND